MLLVNGDDELLRLSIISALAKIDNDDPMASRLLIEVLSDDDDSFSHWFVSDPIPIPEWQMPIDYHGGITEILIPDLVERLPDGEKKNDWQRILNELRAYGKTVATSRVQPPKVTQGDLKQLIRATR